MRRLAEFGRLRVVCGPAAPKMTLARSAIRLQRPSDLRTPTGTQPMRLQKSANGSGAMRRGPLESGSPDNVACHSLVSDGPASRPPVQAALWLAALGLDWAWPRRGNFPVTREWQAVNEFASQGPAFSWKPTTKDGVVSCPQNIHQKLVKFPSRRGDAESPEISVGRLETHADSQLWLSP